MSTSPHGQGEKSSLFHSDHLESKVFFQDDQKDVEGCRPGAGTPERSQLREKPRLLADHNENPTRD